MKIRITQRDIAREAGVDVSTVSLCLSAHPRIPERTREKVLSVATRLGYQRDPALAAIASCRWSGRRDNTGLVIAFVVDDLESAEIELRLYLEGAKDRAEALGYRIEAIQLSDYSDLVSLHRVVRSRGIRGMITGQSRRELPEELFAGANVPTVHCGYLKDVPSDVVRPDLRAAVLRLVRDLQSKGGRIAFFLPVEANLHSDQILLGTALACAEKDRESIRVLKASPEISTLDLSRLRELTPRSVVTINDRHASRILAAGIIQPDNLYTVHTLPPLAGKQGTDLRLKDVGRAAMSLLEIKLRNAPLAHEDYRQNLLIEPRRV